MADSFRIIIRRTGGPEVLERQELGPLQPGPGQLLVQHEAIGLNFLDIYYRTGVYAADLPSGLGHEGAGIVEAIGEGVEGFVAGDRITYLNRSPGAYATHRLLPADRAVKLPAGISSEIAAASLLKGCTAEYLVQRCAKVQPGDTVLVHAAAGGVGSILVPWLKTAGAEVIAHSGTAEKAQLARALGADHSLSCAMDGLAEQVRALTGGEGARIVLDSVGAASWRASLDSVAPRGLMVTYGNASGPVPPVETRELGAKGSIFLTRPSVFDYTATQDELRLAAGRLFDLIGNGTINVKIGGRFALADAADAHRALEARETTGSTLLIP